MEADIQRLEAKLDKLTEAVMRLVILEERQTHTSEMLHTLQAKITVQDDLIRMHERKLEKWINRGIGAWGLVCVSWAILELIVKRI